MNTAPTLAPADAARVDRYLDDLARMLTGAPVAERADALGSVREYVDDSLAALGRPATSDDVAQILQLLGSPDDVAADLWARGLVSAPTAPPVREPSPGDRDATWSVGLGVAALLVPVLGLVLGILALVGARRARRQGTTRDGVATAGMVLGTVAVVVNGLLLVLLVLVVGGGLAVLGVRAGVATSVPASVATAVPVR